MLLIVFCSIPTVLIALVCLYVKQLKQEVGTLLGVQSQLPAGFAVNCNEFEKDDDMNHHMDFISAFGNLRARNYGIEEIDKFAAKLKKSVKVQALYEALR